MWGETVQIIPFQLLQNNKQLGATTEECVTYINSLLNYIKFSFKIETNW